MIEKSISKKNIFFITFLFVFSVIINQYYGDKGVFPLDTFLHFDNGYRILIGEIPFRDYWSVSGPAVDYIQSIFFYFLGANWNAYVFHSSFINGLTTILNSLLVIILLNVRESLFKSLKNLVYIAFAFVFFNISE